MAAPGPRGAPYRPHTAVRDPKARLDTRHRLFRATPRPQGLPEPTLSPPGPPGAIPVGPSRLLQPPGLSGARRAAPPGREGLQAARPSHNPAPTRPPTRGRSHPAPDGAAPRFSGSARARPCSPGPAPGPRPAREGGGGGAGSEAGKAAPRARPGLAAPRRLWRSLRGRRAARSAAAPPRLVPSLHSAPARVASGSGTSGGCGGRRPHETPPPIGSPYPPPPLAHSAGHRTADVTASGRKCAQGEGATARLTTFVTGLGRHQKNVSGRIG